jgi:hypothetical protein
MELPQQVRSQMEFGNEKLKVVENLFERPHPASSDIRFYFQNQQIKSARHAIFLDLPVSKLLVVVHDRSPTSSH